MVLGSRVRLKSKRGENRRSNVVHGLLLLLLLYASFPSYEMCV